ncbi:MAG: hypothetical protein JSW25_01280 [Thermoplasmata archaeon]|nr:MAG: hypothetical protein JSW25_01280 [Thermoplasmata archaeon]
MTDEEVPDITPVEPLPTAECPLIDAVEEKHREARMAAWAGVLVAILGVLSWSTYGFLVCGGAAVAFGLYARRYAPMEAYADYTAGGMLLALFLLRLAEVL